MTTTNFETKWSDLEVVALQEATIFDLGENCAVVGGLLDLLKTCQQQQIGMVTACTGCKNRGASRLVVVELGQQEDQVWVGPVIGAIGVCGLE